MSDPALQPFLGGVNFFSVPTLKMLWERNGVLFISMVLALLHQVAESPAPALPISSLTQPGQAASISCHKAGGLVCKESDSTWTEMTLLLKGYQ